MRALAEWVAGPIHRSQEGPLVDFDWQDFLVAIHRCAKIADGLKERTLMPSWLLRLASQADTRDASSALANSVFEQEVE